MMPEHHQPCSLSFLIEAVFIERERVGGNLFRFLLVTSANLRGAAWRVSF